jgi:bifunctional oligoribonuclease and PAP phosphatase NrnA
VIGEAAWERAVAVLAEASEVVVACHVDPDGDALGSLLGLGGFLRRAGKRVILTWGTPGPTPPPKFAFLPGLDVVADPAEVPEAPDVFVAVDCGSADRLGTLLRCFEAAGTTINLDHHVSNEDFATVNLVDPGAASSAELVFELVRRMGGAPDVAEATALYTGIVTDTGRFQYANTSPATLRTAAALREVGIDHEGVATAIFESSSLAFLHLLGTVLARVRVDDGLVWSWLGTGDLEAAGLALDETESLVDEIRTVRESRFALMLKELPDGGYKGSLRSRGDVDVAAIARTLGGGGHRRAAGFAFEGTPDEAARAVLALAAANGGSSASVAPASVGAAPAAPEAATAL